MSIRSSAAAGERPTRKPRAGAGDAGRAPPGSATKRLHAELGQFMMSADDGIAAFPDADNLFRWTASIAGADGTVYEGCHFNLSFTFGDDYPMKPPTVVFTTPIFHPNVDQVGNICLDILKEKWSAIYNVRTVLLSLRSLLGDPNNDSPLNTEAAQLWQDQEAFRQTVLAQQRRV